MRKEFKDIQRERDPTEEEAWEAQRAIDREARFAVLEAHPLLRADAGWGSWGRC